MVACIDFFEMSEICRPKFIVRHSINNLEHALFALTNTTAGSAAGFSMFYSSITAQLQIHFLKKPTFLVIIRMS
jgi:hypothetical protein